MVYGTNPSQGMDMMITGFNEAIIGVAKRCAQPDLIAYDVEKILNILIKRDGMSHEEPLNI